jgi:hypothetical protein
MWRRRSRAKILGSHSVQYALLFWIKDRANLRQQSGYPLVNCLAVCLEGSLQLHGKLTRHLLNLRNLSISQVEPIRQAFQQHLLQVLRPLPHNSANPVFRPELTRLKPSQKA